MKLKLPPASPLAVVFGLVASVFTSSTHAYTITAAGSGQPVHWGVPKLNLAGNPANRVGLSPDYFFQAVVRGLRRWQAATGGVIQFDYWQGNDADIYVPNSNYNNVSSVYFASALQGGQQLVNTNIIGLTQVWYNPDTAEILEADVVLNDLHYTFTAGTGDTSGPGSGRVSGGVGSQVYLENVLTHELGHAYGLSHSGGLQSTMLYMEAPDQAHLSCDDMAGVRRLYGNAATPAMGSINGRIVRENGTGIFGVQVVAISNDRGVALASSLTDPAGNYTISGLEPGTYHLMAEPFYSGASTLPPYYASVNHSICGGARFGRRFLFSGGQELAPVSVSWGQNIGAGTLTLQCGTSGGAVIPSTVGGTTQGSASEVSSGSASERFAIADRFNGGNDLYYRLSGFSGSVTVRGLSYSLYSSVRANLEILDSAGLVVSSQSVNPTYSSESGYQNFDAITSAVNLPTGDYYLHARRLSNPASTYYPAGSLAVDSVPFLVLAFQLNVSPTTGSAGTPVHAKCRMDENFPPYTSPDGDPRQRDEGGCGMIRRVDGGSGPPDAGTGIFLALSALFPFFAMAASWRYLRAPRRRPLTP